MAPLPTGTIVFRPSNSRSSISTTSLGLNDSADDQYYPKAKRAMRRPPHSNLRTFQRFRFRFRKIWDYAVRKRISLSISQCFLLLMIFVAVVILTTVDNIELKVSFKVKNPPSEPSATSWNESYKDLHPRRYPPIANLQDQSVDMNFGDFSVSNHLYRRRTKKVSNVTVAILSPEMNRYNFPWLIRKEVRTKSLEQSGYRILFSTLKEESGDGVGHAMTIINAELTTALYLGLTYTHRVGSYGSLTHWKHNTVEELFGWGVREIPRIFMEREVCEITRITHRDANAMNERCPICDRIREDSKLRIDRIVEIPDYLSHGCITCYKNIKPADELLKSNTKNFTLFQMSSSHCDRSPKSPDFSLSQNFFYWKYWDKHGDFESNQANFETDSYLLRYADSTQGKRAKTRYNQGELTIAIHARRGDFFNIKQRKMVSSTVFAGLVRKVLRIVQRVGGQFADMPVAVYLYSEGRRKNEGERFIHDVSQMDQDYRDTDGSVRDAIWFHRLIDHGNSLVIGNKTHSHSEKSSISPAGLRVEFRISTPVDEAIHEMVSADIFIGSPSDLSEYVVRILSRSGLALLPSYLGSVRGCCTVTFDFASGVLDDSRTAKEYWSLYSSVMELNLQSRFA